MLSATRKYYMVVISSYVIFEMDGKVLLGRRRNTGYRDGDYGLPAGHVEEAEFATAGAIREAKEEVGVTIKPDNLLPAHVMHRHCEDHERIDFFFVAKKWKGELINNESEKCDALDWFSFNELPKNIMPYVKFALEKYREKHFFSEFIEK